MSVTSFMSLYTCTSSTIIMCVNPKPRNFRRCPTSDPFQPFQPLNNTSRRKISNNCKTNNKYRIRTSFYPIKTFRTILSLSGSFNHVCRSTHYSKLNNNKTLSLSSNRRGVTQTPTPNGFIPLSFIPCSTISSNQATFLHSLVFKGLAISKGPAEMDSRQS
uniref:Uncharacterized protein n=1 Tax=Cacopsylla melanoneura TaxID=428564 RepID=A0A8D9FAQ5_9HEMI